jgi:hypothetical protein
MKEFVNLLWRPLKLDIDTFVAQRNSPDAFKRAFLVVVVVGLFVGIFSGLLMVGGAFLAPDPPATVEEIFPEAMRPILKDMPPAMLDNFRIYLEVQRVIQADRGKFLVNQFLEALALWLTSPIGFLAAIIPFTLLVLLIARLLGGNASLSGMLGCTLLAVTPHLLDPIGIVLGAIPLCGGCLSGIVGLITFVWSIVIYVVAVAVASGFSYAKSIAAILISFALAVLGPTLLLIVFMILMFLVGSIAGAGSS